MQRLASLQVAFWGHPYTSGSASIDYFISSDMFEKWIPFSLHHSRSFSEQLVVFDGLSFALYIDPDDSFHHIPPIQDQIESEDMGERMKEDSNQDSNQDRNYYLSTLNGRVRDVYGRTVGNVTKLLSLSSQATVYVCLQSTMKIHPAFDATLALLLARDVNSLILILRNPSGQLWQDNLQRRLRFIFSDESESQSNILNCSNCRNRILFVDQMPDGEYRNVLCGADLSLDPFPFGGGVTLVDAVACPIPVPFVTLPKYQTVHPIGAGIAMSLNLDTCLIANDVEDYVIKAMIYNRLKNDSISDHIKSKKKILFDADKAAHEWSSFLSGIYFNQVT